VFPTEKGQEVCASVNQQQRQIRYELGGRVRHQLRIIPELRFFLDDSLDYLDRIDELLKQ
jgi:ribosome-binding factor A